MACGGRRLLRACSNGAALPRRTLGNCPRHARGRRTAERGRRVLHCLPDRHEIVWSMSKLRMGGDCLWRCRPRGRKEGRLASHRLPRPPFRFDPRHHEQSAQTWTRSQPTPRRCFLHRVRVDSVLRPRQPASTTRPLASPAARKAASAYIPCVPSLVAAWQHYHGVQEVDLSLVSSACLNHVPRMRVSPGAQARHSGPSVD
jgi:hypothetical protein